MPSPPSPVEITRRLVSIPTVNPPGDEAAAQAYLAGLLEEAGLEVDTYEAEPGRPNLVTRLAGDGDRPTLVLHGHVDTVGVDGQAWTRDPFAAVTEDDVLWGRGTLDNKGGVAMLTHGVLRAVAEGSRLPGDVILALVADSETGASAGLAHLLDHHPEVVSGARYAIGEFGGFPLHAFGRRFSRIGVGMKQYAHLRLRLTGAGGHGSRPARDTVVGRLGRALDRLDRGALPYHRSRIAEAAVEAMAAAVDDGDAALLRGLLDPDRFEAVLEELGPLRVTFESMFRDTANPTIVTAGAKFNVIPSEALVEVDARLLPGRSVGELVDDVTALVDDDAVAVEVLASGPPAPDDYDPGLMDTLAGILTDLDPGVVPVPYLFNESPDGRLFAAHGIQHYGFLPMDLPPEIDLPDLVHAPDERVPVSALEFGAEAIHRLITARS